MSIKSYILYLFDLLNRSFSFILCKKTNVICDTSIWYKLSNKQLKDPRILNYKLIGTGLNVTEFGTSPNLRTGRIEKVQKAATTFLKYENNLININPIDYILINFFEDYEPNLDIEKVRLTSLKSFTKMDVKKINSDTYQVVKKQVDNINQPLKKAGEDINLRASKRVKEIKKRKLKEKIRSADRLLHTKGEIANIISQFTKDNLGVEYKISPDSDKWSNLELFVKTWEAFFKEVYIGSEVVKTNDWPDLFCLVYVKPTYKFWTDDLKWHRIIKDHTKLSHYLID